MYKLYLSFSFLLAVGCVFAGPCSISVHRDLPNPMPVLILNGVLFRPHQPTTQIAENKQLTINCGGVNNQIVAIKEQTATLTCKNGAFTLYGKNRNLADLKCVRIPSAELQFTRLGCAGNRGTVFYSGFTVAGSFHRVFKICYDKQSERAVYTENFVTNVAQSLKIDAQGPGRFSSAGMRFNSYDTNNIYKKQTQMILFGKVFGPRQNYVNDTIFLSRGHLTPSSDFIFPYEQWSTYFYTNCAPEWYEVNAENWNRVEVATRDLAKSIGSDVLTYTSTYGVLQLKTQAGNCAPVYFGASNTIPVPTWYYKVVMHPKLPIDLVFITSNNIFENVGAEVEICPDVCAKYRVDNPVFKDYKKGYTYCCDLREFWKSIMNNTRPYFDLPYGWRYK